MEPTATQPLTIDDKVNQKFCYYTHDITKNVCELLDGAEIIATYDYTPFGDVTTNFISNNLVNNHFAFSSEYHDDELGLIYYNYRHYNPTDGRWLSRDPIAEQGGMNLYNFVQNNATNRIDRLGFLSLVIGGDGNSQDRQFKGSINSMGFAFDWNLSWGLSLSEDGVTTYETIKKITGEFSLNGEVGITFGYAKTFSVFNTDMFLLGGIRGFVGLQASTSFKFTYNSCKDATFSTDVEGFGYIGIEGGLFARIKKSDGKWRDYGIGVRGKATVGAKLSLSCSGKKCSLTSKIGFQKISIEAFVNLYMFIIEKNIYENSNLQLSTSATIEFDNPLVALY